MPDSVRMTLTENATVGLFCIQRYRFLTIDQFARSSGLHRITSAKKLRLFEEQGFLGHFGNTGVRGYGKPPKAYFLTRKGWDCIGTIAKKLKLGRATVKKYLRISMGLLQSPAV